MLNKMLQLENYTAECCKPGLIELDTYFLKNSLKIQNRVNSLFMYTYIFVYT